MSDPAKTKNIGTSNAAVAARSIVWIGNLTEQQKSDVLESTILGQAAADKQHPAQSQEETLDWYNTYINILGSLGWVIQRSEFTEMKYNKTEGTIFDAVLESLMQDATIDKGLYATIARAMLAYSRAGDDSDAAQIFDGASIASSSQFASFQIASASADGDDVILTLLAYFYSSDQEVKDALWFSWEDTTLSIQTCKLDMTLNGSIYDRVRRTIHDKLKDADKLRLLVPLCYRNTLHKGRVWAVIDESGINCAIL